MERTSARTRFSLVNTLRDLCYLLCLLGALASLAGACAIFFEPDFWIADQLAHFALQHAGLSIGAVLGFFILRSRLLFFSIPVAVYYFFLLAPYYPRPQTSSQDKAHEPLRLVVANVLTRNGQHDEVFRNIAAQAPDVVLLLEVDERWLSAAAQLKETLPHSLILPRRDNFGIAIFSAVPLQDGEILKIPGQPPFIDTKLLLPDRTVRLIGAHTVPPRSFEGFTRRNAHLALFAERLAEKSGEPTIVAGDLNITPWSQYLKRFIDRTRLRDARLGLGLYPTWPAALPLMGIPIDHCLVSPDFEVSSFETLQLPGSDHKGLVIDLRL